jgi:hypothetical protein
MRDQKKSNGKHMRKNDGKQLTERRQKREREREYTKTVRQKTKKYVRGGKNKEKGRNYGGFILTALKDIGRSTFTTVNRIAVSNNANPPLKKKE